MTGDPNISLWISSASTLATLIIAIFAVVQAVAAKRAADAAKFTAQILIEGNRPHISVTAHGNPPQDLLDPATPRMQLELQNQGLTPAFEVRHESWIEVLKLPFEDFTPAADHFESQDSYMLAPNSRHININIPIRAGLTEYQRADIRAFRSVVCVRVRVAYRDNFTARRRFANFAYWVGHDGLSPLPKYNDVGEEGV
jgi:hypothetical protein